MPVGYETGLVSLVAVNLAGQVFNQLTGGLITQLTAPVRRWFQEGQNKLKFKSALKLCLDALYASNYAIEGPGAIDESFLCHKQVCQELWSKLLDPTSDDEIDTHKLVEVYNEVWENSSGFSDKLKSHQHEAIDFLVSVLYDEILWEFPQFVHMLNTKILRRLDTWVPPLKRRRVIERYLQSASTQVQNRQQKLMRRGKYIEPIIQKFIARPERGEQFRQLTTQKWGPAQVSPAQFTEVDINECFSGELDRRLMIIADSGYGKTTLLQELMLRAARTWRPGRPVPFFFSPNQAAICREDSLRIIIFERLATAARLVEPLHVRANQLRAIASELKDKGELFLLFDALDQITDPQGFLGYIEGTSLVPNRTVVTARPSAWEAHKGSLRGFALLRLVEFDQKQKEAYFGKLLETPQLRELPDSLLAIPILASHIRELLTEQRMEVGEIVNKSDLYCEFMHKLPTRDQDRQILGSRRPEDALADMQKLAFETLRRGYLGQFPRDVAKEIIGESNLNTSEQLQFVLKFLEISDLVGFRHRSFQEYFAAEVLLREWTESGSTDAIEKYLFHPNWEETVTFAAGLIKDAEKLKALLDLILHPKGNPPLLLYHDHLRLACSCLHEAKVSAPRAMAKVLAKIDELMLTHVQTALSLLGDWGREEAEERLISSLKNPDHTVRLLAAIVLWKIGSEQAIDPLLGSLKDKWPTVTALGKIEWELTEDASIEALKDTDEYKRWSAAIATGEISSERAIDMLIEALKGAEGEVREFVAGTLDKINSEREQIIDTSIEAVMGSGGALAGIFAGMLDKINSERERADDDALIEGLKDFHVRWFATVALAEIGSEQAIDPLIEALKDATRKVRESIAHALTKLNSARVLEAALTAYDCPEFVQARADLLNIIKTVDRALRAQRSLDHA